MQVMIDLYKRFDKAVFFLNAYYDVFSLCILHIKAGTKLDAKSISY